MKEREYLEAVDLTPEDRLRYELSHTYCEISRDPYLFDTVEQKHQLSDMEHPDFSDYEIDSLKKAINKLTDKQREIVNLYLEGLTQEQIAQEVGIRQTTVHKTIFGNIDYVRNKRCGGVLEKLKRLIIGVGCKECKSTFMPDYTNIRQVVCDKCRIKKRKRSGKCEKCGCEISKTRKYCNECQKTNPRYRRTTGACRTCGTETKGQARYCMLCMRERRRCQQTEYNRRRRLNKRNSGTNNGFY